MSFDFLKSRKVRKLSRVLQQSDEKVEGMLDLVSLVEHQRILETMKRLLLSDMAIQMLGMQLRNRVLYATKKRTSSSDSEKMRAGLVTHDKEKAFLKKGFKAAPNFDHLERKLWAGIFKSDFNSIEEQGHEPLQSMPQKD